MIAESVAFLVAEGKRVIYDAEHFFDGWRDDRDYALACLRAAAAAGAENVTLCDTNGASLPARGRRAPCARWSPRCPTARVGIHTHNDAECGVANSLAAVAEGARHRPGDDERLRRALRQRQPRLASSPTSSSSSATSACPTLEG